jgi:alpha-1,6-mannosyltransferase
VGRFAVEKRWDVVIDAFVRARDRGLDAVLALFGDGPERERMKARAEGRDDVVFLGFERDRTKLATALASADALVHGCPYETFGLSIAEALACGLPAVVPDEGGAAEMIDESCGEIYESLDVDACARAIERIAGRDREALRKGAIARASRVLTVEEQFSRELDELRGLLRARRA